MEARALHFSYSDAPFLTDLSVTFERGKITTILGPNGCGKSTLLNLFVRQFSPKKGQIILDDRPISGLRQKEVAARLAVVHQQNTAPADLSVEELVGYGRVPHQSFWKGKSDQDQAHIDWAMRATNIDSMKDKCICELSGGERQRAWIAMALAQKTEILFLDEPTTYLDIAYQIEILNLVRELNRVYGITIIMVLHDINQAIQYSDRLVIMKSGQIRYSGSVDSGITSEILNDTYGIDVVIRHCPVNQCKYIIPIQLDACRKERCS